MNKFKPGASYYTRSIGDHNCIFSILVASRTKQTVVAYVDESKTAKRFRISLDYDGNESIMPHGRHSMAPCISAAKTERPLKDWERKGVPTQESVAINAPKQTADCLVIESRLCEECGMLYVHDEGKGFDDKDICPSCFKEAMVASYGRQGAVIQSMATVHE